MTSAAVPVTLFVWGPGRIVPVRVTDLTITEQLYNPSLNPIHAEAQLSLRVLTPAELDGAARPTTTSSGTSPLSPTTTRSRCARRWRSRTWRTRPTSSSG